MTNTRPSASSKPVKPAKPPRTLVGWREWAGLPDLGVAMVKAKVDTGARTSALHAWNIRSFERDAAPWVAFEVHPFQNDKVTRIICEARVHDRRLVRSSTGHAQERFVIRTTLALGDGAWPIELTLARRDEMGFRMLIGRSALRRRAIVDPARSYLCPNPEWSRANVPDDQPEKGTS